MFTVIVACFELYLRATRRDRQAGYGFISIIAACYLFQDLLALFGGFPITGTSGVGSSMLVATAVIIYFDLNTREKFVSKSTSLVQWLIFPLLLLAGIGILIFILLYIWAALCCLIHRLFCTF